MRRVSRTPFVHLFRSCDGDVMTSVGANYASVRGTKPVLLLDLWQGVLWSGRNLLL